MKNIKLILLLIILLGPACSPTGKRHPAWKDMPVVARMETVNGHPLTVASLDLLKDTMNLPLSALVEELQIVRLENREEALVEPGYVCMSDNYMLVVNWKTPCKLFRKDGTFVCKVGNIGLGTGEYKWIYDVQIDEKNGRIYLLQQGTREILSYNLEGNEGRILLSEVDWRDVQLMLDSAYPDFTQKLKREFPALTEKDINFCCLVKIHMSLQNLSQIYCISGNSVSRRKLRLKEKLGIDKEDSLTKFLDRLV